MNPLIRLFTINLGALLLMTSCEAPQEGTSPQYRDLITAVYSTVTVVPAEVYTVYPPVSGIIAYSELEEGQKVEEGALLFRINNRLGDLNQANAQLNYEIALETYSGESTVLKELAEQLQVARVKLANDSLNFERQARLWAKNIGARQTYESRKLAYELSRSELTRLENNYTRTRKELARKMQQAKNNLRISDVNRQEFKVKSKMNGTIYEVLKEVGEAVSLQTPVALVGNTDSFVLRLLIDEVDIASVFIGQPTVVALDAYPEQTFSAAIQRIYPTKDERSQTFTVEATFQESSPRLFNGLSGEANIIVAQKSSVLTLPKQLVSEQQTVETDAGTVKVETGIADLQYIEIINGIDTSTVIYQQQ